MDAGRRPEQPQREGGGADGYVFHIRPDGRIRWEIPSLGEVVTGRVDGRPMPIRRPGAPGQAGRPEHAQLVVYVRK